MLLKTLRKVDVVEVVEAVDRVAQSFVIFLFEQQVVVCVVNGFEIELG